MTYQEIIKKIKPELEETASFFKEELMKIHTSRLSPALIENIEAEIAGSSMPLKSLGAISSVSARELNFQPWDRLYIDAILKALEKSNLGLSVGVDKDKIRLTSPILTGEHSKNLIHLVSEKLNEAIQKIRRSRDKVWKELQEKSREGEIREDDKFKGKDELEESINDYKKKMEDMVENKKKEIQG